MYSKQRTVSYLWIILILQVFTYVKGSCFGVPKSRWVEVEVCEQGQGRALSSICASEGVIIANPGVTGAKTVIWREGSGGKTWRRMLWRSGGGDKEEGMVRGSS